MSYCTKNPYGADEAQRTLDKLVMRWRTGTLKDPCFARRAYKCPDCGWYHLTKQDARRPNPTDLFATGAVPRKPVNFR